MLNQMSQRIPLQFQLKHSYAILYVDKQDQHNAYWVSPACSHGPSNENRLSCQLVVDRDEGMMGRERTGRSFAVNKEGTLLTLNQVPVES